MDCRVAVAPRNDRRGRLIELAEERLMAFRCSTKYRHVDRGDVFCSGTDQVCVGGVVKGVEGFAGGQYVLAKRLSFSVGSRVSDHYRRSHVRDELVSKERVFRCDVCDLIRERRHHCETSISHGGSAVDRPGRNAVIHAAGETPDYGMGRPEEDAEAFQLHGRVEAADDEDAFVAETRGKVVGLENQITGALDRAEKGNLGKPQDRGISDDSDIGFVFQIGFESHPNAKVSGI